MLYRLKDLIDGRKRATDLLQRITGAADYWLLSRHLVKMAKLWEIEEVGLALSTALKDFLDYGLFVFAVRNGRSVDVWIDPMHYNISFIDILQDDFGRQDIDYNISYFDGLGVADTGGGLESEDHYRENLRCYTITGSLHLSRLYILPKKKLPCHHDRMIGILLETAAAAVENSLKMKLLEDAASVDPLTNCYNRRALNSYIGHHIANAKRYGGDLSLVLFDLDDFKKINDLYGHSAGDEVLREVSAMVLSSIRRSDYLVRYGGEEFVLILPNTSFSAALELAERLRAVIETRTIPVGKERIALTASFGVTALRNGEDFEALLAEADCMLYRAKAAGKNRVMPELHLFSGSTRALTSHPVVEPGYHCPTYQAIQKSVDKP